MQVVHPVSSTGRARDLKEATQASGSVRLSLLLPVLQLYAYGCNGTSLTNSLGGRRKSSVDHRWLDSVCGCKLKWIATNFSSILWWPVKREVRGKPLNRQGFER